MSTDLSRVDRIASAVHDLADSIRGIPHRFDVCHHYSLDLSVWFAIGIVIGVLASWMIKGSTR